MRKVKFYKKEEALYKFDTYKDFYVWMKMHPGLRLTKKTDFIVDGIQYNSALAIIQAYERKNK